MVVVLEYAQSMTSGGHIEEPLIFQRELQKKIAGPNRKEQSEKKHHGRHGAHGPEGRNQEKSANAESDDQQEQTNRSSQEKLKSDIAKFVGQQDTQGFRGVDQITERTLWGKRDQIAAEHVGSAIGRTHEFLEERNLQASGMSDIYDKYRILSIESSSGVYFPPARVPQGATLDFERRRSPGSGGASLYHRLVPPTLLYSELGWFLVWRKCRLADILFSLGHGHQTISKHLHLAGAQEPCLCQALGSEPCLWMLRFRP